MQAYDYLKPDNLNHVLEAKSCLGSSAVFLAGGTDVMVRKRAGLISFKTLISLRGIKELKQIRDQGQSVFIGAGASFEKILKNELAQKELPNLISAIKTMGCTQMRNIATMGGNVMSAVSSADTSPVLLSMDATCHLASLKQKRILPISQMFVGPRTTACHENEILLGFSIAKPSNNPRKTAAAFSKLGRRKSLDLALVNVACFLEFEKDEKTIAKAKIASGAVGPTPMLLNQAAKFLEGNIFSQELIEQAGFVAADECLAWDDIRASAWYRREILKILLPRVLESAFKEIT